MEFGLNYLAMVSFWTKMSGTAEIFPEGLSHPHRPSGLYALDNSVKSS